MRADQRTTRGEDQRGIVVLLRGGIEFWNTSAYKIRFCFCGDGGERMEGRGLLLGGRGREQGFGIFGEVLCAVGGVEAFGEDN